MKLLSCVLFIIFPPLLFSQIPVIPGAAGWGINTPAGRGGTIYRVTNLNASGTGSLKSALEANGPRVIIFETSGTIVLSGWLFIDDPFVTVAGQTAPSPGITIRGGGIRIRTHDVLIQHLRIRVGDATGGTSPVERDGIEILANEQNCYNVVLDHCSVSWGLDENISIYSPSPNYTNHDITIRYCITSEGLWHSTHPEGPHSMGLLVGGDSGGRHDYIALVSNLMAHNNQRNPLSQSRSLVNVNNVAYNWGEYGFTLVSEGAVNKASGVGNVYLAGPSTSPASPITFSRYLMNGSQVYLSDNLAAEFSSVYSNYASFNPIVDNPPFWPDGLVALPASTTRMNVLANAGARPTDRDAVDTRIVNDVLHGTGELIDSQNDVGGWPVLQQTTRTLTTPSNPHGDSDGDGYTNLEEWLHGYSTGVGGDGTNKMVAVNFPNGGETLVSDSVRNIQWESTGTIPNVKLEYSTNNGSSWIVIQSSIANTGTYAWTIPNVSTSTGLLRVTDVAATTLFDESNATFSITQTAPVTTIFSEGFETNTIPGSIWLTEDWNASAGRDYWGEQTSSSGARVHSGTKSAYCADNSSAAGQTYDLSQNTYVKHKDGVEISGFTNVQISYWIWYKTYDSRDYVTFQYQSGSAWIELQRFYGTGSGSQVWAQKTVAVPANAGSEFNFRWVFLSNGNNNSEGAYIDDIVITGNPTFSMIPGTPTNLEVEPQAEVPQEPALLQNFPNPFNPSTKITYSIPHQSHVTLRVFNLLGQEVAHLVDGPMAAGQHTVEFNANTLADGVYFSTLDYEGKRFTKKMVLLK